jgi:hypothetical protein
VCLRRRQICNLGYDVSRFPGLPTRRLLNSDHVIADVFSAMLSVCKLPWLDTMPAGQQDRQVYSTSGANGFAGNGDATTACELHLNANGTAIDQCFYG